MKHIDENGFTVNEGHDENLDLSFLDGGRLDNAFEDAAFGVSPEFFAAQRRNDIEDFEGLVDASQG